MFLQPRYDRPPEGLARGRWDAPPWAIGVLGALVILGALAWLVLRARRAAKRRRGGPVSARGVASSRKGAR
jgi:hypothetical protein